jgi:hypothetical protein
MSIGHSNALVKFSEGEEVVEGDFNALQNCLTERAWEVPGMADLTAFDEVGQAYSDAFSDNGALWAARNYGVFTRGGGLLPSAAGLVSSLGGGVVGIWSNPGNLPPEVLVDGVLHDDSTASRTMRWVFLSGSTWSYTHGATSSGQYRVDIVTCKIDEGAAWPTSRSFQDAVTGALTSQSPYKQMALTLDLDASTAVTVGAEAASAAAAIIPAIPTGRRLLYYVLVHDSAMTVFDCTIPVGSLITAITLPVNSAIYRAGPAPWVEDYSLIGGLTGSYSTGAAVAFCIPPESITGDPSVRILGALVTARLTADHTVHIQSNATHGAWSPSDIADVTGLFTRDGQYHSTLIDLRGLPHGAGSLPAVAGIGPVWANGAHTKVKNTAGDQNSIGITFGQSNVSLWIGSITWYAVRG